MNDLVKVTRCKDCEHWKKYPYRNSKKGSCGKYRISKYPDGYCDEGVKRE